MQTNRGGRALRAVLLAAAAAAVAIAASSCDNDDEVTPPTPTGVLSVTIVPDTLRLRAGDSGHLRAVVETSDDATDTTVVWTSRDTMVAGVDGMGTVRAVGAGVTTVTGTAAADAGKFDSSVVLVGPSPIRSVTLTPDSLVLVEGDSAMLAIEVDADPGSDSSTTLRSTNENVATVDINGVVTGVSADAGLRDAEAFIVAVSNFDPTKSDSTHVRVIAAGGVADP